VTARPAYVCSIKTNKGNFMSKQSDIEATLLSLVKPGITSKQLQREIGKAHPKASKKDIRLAAFAAMISIVDKSPDAALQFQDLAITKATETVED
jgi:hypothetical protein